MPADRNLFGVLNVHKPAGVTSRDVVNRIQRLIRPVKVGHAGTLDPMATGVLLVCVGPATRLVSMLQEGQKTYAAEFLLGQTSDTDDSTGQVEHHVIEGAVPSLDDISAKLQAMVGTISQVPPDYSAVHVDGQRAYSLARKGEEVTLKAKEVEIHRIDVTRYDWPKLDLEITCGSGTYIRSIARDLGLQLGCGGLMSRLERTRIGGFAISESVDADSLTLDNLQQALCPAVRIVDHLAKFDCEEPDVFNLLCGRQLSVDPTRLRESSELLPGQSVALTRDGFSDLIALAEVTEAGLLQPRTVFIPVTQAKS